MNRNLLSMLVASALFGTQYNMAEAGPASEPTPPELKYKFDAAHVKSWAEEGQKAGQFTLTTFKRAERSVRELLLDVAKVIGGTPSAEDFLTGYSNVWANKDTAKSRKADARLIFEAFSLKDGDKPYQYTKTVGYKETKNEKGEFEPIVETKSCQEWLRQYDGEWKGFLDLAREIRNKSSGRASQGTPVAGDTSTGSRRLKMTEKQHDAVMEQLPVANANQAQSIIQEATKQLTKMPNWELAILAEMEMCVNHLKTTKNPLFLDAAAEMVDVLNSIREKLAEVEKQRQAAVQNTQGDKGAFTGSTPQPQVQGEQIKAPAPATQQKAA